MKDRCRVCLAGDRNTYSIANTALEQTYNVISSVKLQRAGRPTALCCVCVSQLRRCRRFIDTARESNAALDRWNQDHTYTNFKLSEQPLVMLSKNQLFQIMCDGALELEVNQEVVETDDARINEDNELTFLTEEIEYEVTLDYDQSDPALVLHDEKDIIQPTDVKKDITEMSENEDYTQFSSIKIENSVINECPLTDGSELKKWRPITVGDQLSDLDTASTPKVKRKIFSCSQCNYQTAVKTDFKRHSTKHTGEKPFACDQCDYKCTRKRSLKRHFLSHTGEKPYACEKCNYRGISRVHLKRHFMIHTGEKPFMCNKCDYKCNKMNNLKTHLLTHTSEKPYACDLCDFKCKQKSNLKMHLLTHTGEKAFACDKCDYKCSRKGALQKHLMIHTGEKPFSCDKCDYKSNVKEQIKRHSMIHTGEKPFACDKCDYRTNLRSSLRRHSIIHS